MNRNQLDMEEYYRAVQQINNPEKLREHLKYIDQMESELLETIVITANNVREMCDEMRRISNKRLGEIS